MFLKYKVDIPVVPGKLVRKNRGGHTYIEYEYDRIYDPVKQYTYPKRASIGRVDPENPTRMTPNENFLKYFPDAEISELMGSDRASSKGYIVRWVEAPSNKLLTTAFEASLESVTVTCRLSVDSKIAGIAMEHRNPKVSEGRHRGQGGRQYMHLSLW